MRTRIYAQGANFSGAGKDAVHIIGDAEIYLEGANLSNSGSHAIYVDQSQMLARIRTDFALPSDISDADIREAAQMAAVVPEPWRSESLEHRTVGRWAKENGWQVSQIAVALSQLGVAIAGL
jgi:hypothetical protein